MKMDEFEQRLQRQPLRQVPVEWRGEILAAAAASQGKAAAVDRALASAPASQSWLSTLNARLSTLLWPHPVAWAGLAAIWILIFAASLSIRDRSPGVAEQAMPPSPEMMAELKEQRRLLAELMGPRDAVGADRSKHLGPGPRTQRVDFGAA
jgi:hypothetical protein